MAVGGVPDTPCTLISYSDWLTARDSPAPCRVVRPIARSGAPQVEQPGTRLLEQGLAEPVAGGGHPGWHGEQGTAGVLDVVVERVSGGQLRLDRHELPARILLVGDEEQPSVQLPGHRVDAVGEGVAPAQELLAAVA